jgi:hypothetical protein
VNSTARDSKGTKSSTVKRHGDKVDLITKPKVLLEAILSSQGSDRSEQKKQATAQTGATVRKIV